MTGIVPISVFKVADRSMEPALKDGDFLIATQWFASLKVGDIVVLRHPAKAIKLVKRISSISDNSVYVIGDNKDLSEDSRSFGAVSKDKIVAKVLFSV